MTAKQWTTRRRRALEAYVRALAPALRLADWTIAISWPDMPDALAADQADFPDEDLANITPHPGSKHATLRVSPRLLTLTAHQQTQVLCHELVHCHLFALVELTQATLALLSKRERAVAELALNMHVEMTTDALADALVPLVPLFDVETPAGAASKGNAPSGAR